jgi:hypothetical protein
MVLGWQCIPLHHSVFLVRLFDIHSPCSVRLFLVPLFICSLPLVLPYHPYQLCPFGKISTLTIAFAGNAAAGGANVIASFIYHSVVLVAAIAAEKKHPFAVVAVFGHFGRRVPPGFLFNGFNFFRNTGWDCWLRRFTAALLRQAQ